MPGPLEPHDPSRLRISDADRDKVATILRDAAGEGRIDLAELDERLEATYAAKTYADLVPITADLPAHPPGQTLPAPRSAHLPAATTSHQSSWVVMGEVKRKGAWRVPEQHTAFALMGTVELDLRQATFGGRQITINANAIMGEVKVLVDERTHVHVDGLPIMGEFSQSADKVPARFDADSPTVSVKGLALMGSVHVVRLPPPGTPRKFLGTY